MKRAGTQRRMVAGLLDSLVTQALAAPLFVFAAWHVLGALFFAILVPCTDGKSQAQADQAMQQAMMFVVLDLAVVVVYSLLDVFLRGTPGKRMSDLRIRGADGSPAEMSQLLLRWFCRNTWLLCYLVAVFVAWQTGERFDSKACALLIWLARLLTVLTFAAFLMSGGPDGLALYDRIAGTNVFRVDLPDDPNEPDADATRVSATDVNEFGVSRDVIARKCDDDFDDE